MRGYLSVAFSFFFFFLPVLALICLPKTKLWSVVDLIWCFNFVLLHFVIPPLNVVYHCTWTAVFFAHRFSPSHVHGWCCVRYDYPNLCEFRKNEQKKKERNHPPVAPRPPDGVPVPPERDHVMCRQAFCWNILNGTMNFCYCFDFPFAYVSVLSSKLLLSSSIPRSQTMVPSGFSNIQ